MTSADDRAVCLLEKMLRLPSLTGREDRLAACLIGEMAKLGFDAGLDAVGNVVGTIGSRADDALQVMILGHMDTVPGAVEVRRQEGLLYGRGAVDAKGPLSTGIIAASRAAASGGRAHITVIGAVQEEGASMGARLVATMPPPDYLIIAEPSGWDALALGYKGSQRFNLEITVPAGHSAGPEATAAEAAFDFWGHLVAWCAQQTSRDAPPDHAFYRLTPSLVGMTTRQDGLEASAYLDIGLRLPPGLEPAEVQSGVRALLPGSERMRARFCFSAGDIAIRQSKSGCLVAAFMRSIRSENGKPRFTLKTGTSDLNIVGPVWNCPALAYGPGDSKLDHTPDERISIDEYLRAIRVLTASLRDL